MTVSNDLSVGLCVLEPPMTRSAQAIQLCTAARLLSNRPFLDFQKPLESRSLLRGLHFARGSTPAEQRIDRSPRERLVGLARGLVDRRRKQTRRSRQAEPKPRQIGL